MDQATPPDARPDASADARLRDLLDRLSAGAPFREPGLDLAHLNASPAALAGAVSYTHLTLPTILLV